MKYEIYGRAPTFQPPEPTVRLRLTAAGREAFLSVVDSLGHPIPGGVLIRFESDGSFSLLPAVDPRLGLPLTKSGKLVEASGAATGAPGFPLDI